MTELLVVPALAAYGVAAVAYARDLRGPGRAGRVATWGVRIGWLAQTALLFVQASRGQGFPWGTWAGALNLSAPGDFEERMPGIASWFIARDAGR